MKRKKRNKKNKLSLLERLGALIWVWKNEVPGIVKLLILVAMIPLAFLIISIYADAPK